MTRSRSVGSTPQSPGTITIKQLLIKKTVTILSRVV